MGRTCQTATLQRKQTQYFQFSIQFEPAVSFWICPRPPWVLQSFCLAADIGERYCTKARLSNLRYVLLFWLRSFIIPNTTRFYSSILSAGNHHAKNGPSEIKLDVDCVCLEFGCFSVVWMMSLCLSSRLPLSFSFFHFILSHISISLSHLSLSLSLFFFPLSVRSMSQSAHFFGRNGGAPPTCTYKLRPCCLLLLRSLYHTSPTPVILPPRRNTLSKVRTARRCYMFCDIAVFRIADVHACKCHRGGLHWHECLFLSS